MDSSPLLRPVGPLPPRVYWTRRIGLLAVVAVLLVVVAVSCSGGSGSPHARSQPSPTPSPTPTPTQGTARAAAACTRAQLSVTAATDADQYPAGSLPRLRVTVRNTGSGPCVLTESPSSRTWTIVSGTDQVWTTTGCASSHTATATTLGKGSFVRHTIVWNRHRSGKQCAVSSTEAGAGTYQLTVTVNGITSAPAVFHLSA